MKLNPYLLSFTNKKDEDYYYSRSQFDDIRLARLVSFLSLLLCINSFFYEASVPESIWGVRLTFNIIYGISRCLAVFATWFSKPQRLSYQIVCFISVVLSMVRGVLVTLGCENNIRLSSYLECPGEPLFSHCSFFIELYFPSPYGSHSSRTFDT